MTYNSYYSNTPYFFRYKKAVLKAQKILQDQPLKGLDKAVWWIEYVLRHGDVSHLRSASANMSFFEYFMIDVIIFVILLLVLIVFLIVISVRFTSKLLTSFKKVKIS